MKEPKWVDQRALELLQKESLAEHGGRAGIRDEALLESAHVRPRQLRTYEADADLARLAAAYAAGLVRNHPFGDGNKRAALLAVGLFLGLNGYRLVSILRTRHALFSLLQQVRWRNWSLRRGFEWA